MELIGKKSAWAAFKLVHDPKRRKNSLLKKAASLEINIQKEIEYILPKNGSTDNIEKYFSVLGIKPTSDKAKIRVAYISKAKEYHPDINKKSGSEEAMKQINEAYTNLTGNKVRIDAVTDEKRKITEIERLSFDLYIKLRKSDYEKMLGTARQGITKPELIALIDDFCDWNKRFSRVEKAITGKLDKRLKALEKHKDKCEKYIKSLNNRDLNDIADLNKCITEINNSLRIGYAFRSYADIAFANAKEKLAPIEREQKEKLLIGIG
jgi:hypothetical protein